MFRLSKLLYNAGHFFNPQYQFEGDNRSLSDEVHVGLKNVIGKLAIDRDGACEVINQVSLIVYTFLLLLFIKTFRNN